MHFAYESLQFANLRRAHHWVHILDGVVQHLPVQNRNLVGWRWIANPQAH